MSRASLFLSSSMKCVLRESCTHGHAEVLLVSVLLQYKVKTANRHLSQKNNF